MKLLIVDDHELLRTGVMAACRETNLFEEIFECAESEKVLQVTQETKPDYIFMDISMPVKNGIQIIEELREAGYEGKIITLTSYEDDQYIYKAWHAGANGYISKRSASEEIFIAVNKIENGEKFYVAGKSWGEVDRLLRSYESVFLKNLQASEVTFTDRERQVLTFLIRGLTSTEIGKLLKISNRTVEVYRSNLLSKFESANLVELIYKLRQNGLLSKFEQTAG